MDKYSLNARIYPMVIFYMPLIILAVIFSIEFDKYIHLATAIGIIGALSYLFAQIGRDAGKSKEKRLWEDWGGSPTTQLLRWNNNIVDEHTKKRYHDKLIKLCPTGVNPTISYERNFPAEADKTYQSWVKYLLIKTRDTSKYYILFKDNMSYGFRRNLWGLKPFAIGLILILSIATFVYYWCTLKSYNLKLFPIQFFIAQAILFLVLLLWVFRITSNWIKVPAYSYAERLLEAVENLS